jgi:electron transfer flavoprotein alpha subunit
MSGEVWTFSELAGDQLREISLELLAWGRKMADARNSPLCAVVLTDHLENGELSRLFQYGADKVYLIEHPSLAHFLVEPFAKTLIHLVLSFQPEILLAGATTTGRTVMPYVSVRLHTGLTADCTGLEIEPETGNLLQIRPAIGGNILATIKTPNHRPQMATVRPKSICLLEADPSHPGELIRPEVPAEMFTTRMRFEEVIHEAHGVVALEEAELVVSGGQGLQNADAFCILEEFAQALGAAVGSSRPPVDLGWQPYVHQVGLSGRTISPALYIACGISGSVQHLAGIQTAKNIIAINRDPEAAIFQVADFGIVGDVFQVLPVLTSAVKAFQASNGSDSGSNPVEFMEPSASSTVPITKES